MRTLGLDIGDKRTGVAVSDPGGILATPVTVLDSTDENTLINEILELVKQYGVECIVVGLPRHLSGELGKQADKVTDFAGKLSRHAKQSSFKELDVQLWDERLSTKAARRLKSEAGGKSNKVHSKVKRRTRNQDFSAKAAVDSIAAAFILQGFLDSRHPD